ncbi:hypothetical protein JCM10212_006320 [Sporobolomyces blumeae]
MTTPNQPRTSTSRTNRDDVLQFLDSLDKYSGSTPSTTSSTAPPATSSSNLPRSTSASTFAQHPHHRPSSPPAAHSSNAQEAQSVLDFLDEITQTRPSPAAGGGGAATTHAPPAGSSARAALEKKPSVPSSLGRSTSRNNLGAVAVGGGSAAGAGGGPGQGPVSATTTGRRSTDSVRSQRSLGGLGSATTTAQGGARVTAAGGAAAPSAANANAASSSSSSANAVRPHPPSSPASTASRTVASSTPPPPPPSSTAQTQSPASAPTASAAAAGGGGGGWGWSSVWSSASSALTQATQIAQQARTAAEEQVHSAGLGTMGGALGEGLLKRAKEGNEQAKKWSEGVLELAKGASLDQLGKELKSSTIRSLTDLLNAVAPPIAEHEVIEVSLSHGMKGYDGVETLVYRGLAKIMDQIEGGTLVVNRGFEDEQEEARAKGQAETEHEGEEERNLNYVHGLEEGWKTAEATLERLVKRHYKPPTSPTPNADGVVLPVTTCPVYLRIQPCLAPLPSLPVPSAPPSSSTPAKPSTHLFFLLHLVDPTHSLTHHAVSQSLPSPWLEIPFEENEWVEDQMVEVIRRAVEVVGQEYIMGRMRAQGNAIEHARSEAQKVLFEANQHDVEQGQGPGAGQREEEEISAVSQEARVGIV